MRPLVRGHPPRRPARHAHRLRRELAFGDRRAFLDLVRRLPAHRLAPRVLHQRAQDELRRADEGDPLRTHRLARPHFLQPDLRRLCRRRRRDGRGDRRRHDPAAGVLSRGHCQSGPQPPVPELRHAPVNDTVDRGGAAGSQPQHTPAHHQLRTAGWWPRHEGHPLRDRCPDPGLGAIRHRADGGGAVGDGAIRGALQRAGGAFHGAGDPRRRKTDP